MYLEEEQIKQMAELDSEGNPIGFKLDKCPALPLIGTETNDDCDYAGKLSKQLVRLYKAMLSEKCNYKDMKNECLLSGTPCTDCDKVDDGHKADDGKERWDLLPFAPIEEVVRVLTHGAKKYGDNNWRKVDISRYKAALMRHVSAMMKGKWVDSESGLSHVAHAICNLIFIKELYNAEQ